MRYERYKHPFSTIGTIVFFLGIFTPVPFFTAFFAAIVFWSIGSHYEKEYKFWAQDFDDETSPVNNEPIIVQQPNYSTKYQFCTACGSKYRVGTNFCNDCGQKSWHRSNKRVVTH